MILRIPMRQRAPKALVILAFLSFPITINFFSPYVMIDGAMNGIINGSLVMFGLMFLSSLFIGRLWCGWIFPGAGMQEMVEPIHNKLVNGLKVDWIKWEIWIIWISLIIVFSVNTGGYKSIELLYHTQNRISLAGTEDRPIFFVYFIYYVVLAQFIGLATFVGRRKRSAIRFRQGSNGHET